VFLAYRWYSDYKDDGTNILLDANENAYGPGLDLDRHGRFESQAVNGHAGSRDTELDLLGLHRYPDP
jgi:histidinol-phosphate aminotransferase